jgi:hypothetical protein
MFPVGSHEHPGKPWLTQSLKDSKTNWFRSAAGSASQYDSSVYEYGNRYIYTFYMCT